MFEPKKYIDKNTGDLYMKCCGMLLKCINENDVELEEVGNRKYTHTHSVRVDKGISDILKTEYQLKDTISVPMNDDRSIEFRVEHIENGEGYKDIYVVSVEIVGYSSMDDIDKFLNDFEDNMPYELVQNLRVIDHAVNDVHNNRKVSLLSRGNLVDTDCYCNGADDMIFDGLRTEAERCKNYKGETHWYWTDTRSPILSNSTSFYFVSSGGSAGNYTTASYTFGVVPCFSIRVSDDT